MKTFDDVLKQLEFRRKSPRTVRTYGSVYTSYKDFLGQKKPTVENAEEFLKGKGHLSGASISLYSMALRTFFRENDIDVSKKQLKNIKFNNIREDKFVTRKEVDTLHKGCNTLRDKVIIRLLYHAGLRSIELVNLNIGDLVLKQEKIRVKGVKGSPKARHVRLIRPELVKPTIRAYLVQCGINPDKKLTDEERKWPLIISKTGKRLQYMGISAVVKNLGTSIDKPDLTAHWLRHGFVVWNKVHGVPPEITALQIGDTIETTMKIYSHYRESDVNRIYDAIQGKIPDDETIPDSKNPIDEIDELKTSNQSLGNKLEEINVVNKTLAERLEKIENAIAQGLLDKAENFAGKTGH